MRTFSYFPLLLFLQLFILKASCQVYGQYSIPLKKGLVTPVAGFDQQLLVKLNRTVLEEPVASILQFSGIPTDQQKKTLLLNGITLLNYIGGNAYLISIHKPLHTDVLTNNGVRSILSIEPNDKINFFLQNVNADTTVNATIFSFTTNEDAIVRLNEKGFRAQTAYGEYPVLKIQVPAGRLTELAGFEFIEYIEPLPPPVIELNYKSTSGTRANVLHTSNYNLNGEGVVFQVNEATGYPQDHIDLVDRSIGNKVFPTGAYHSTHVHGIIAGAGLINELYKGYAPKARFNTSSTISLDNSADIRTYGADLTNNSYSSGSICSKASPSADYISTLIADKQAIEFKSLIHVMAAGNSGNVQCPVYPFGYNTVYSGYQSAKSTLTVGATFSNGVLADFSSKGPGRGRFKPEIVAPGANIISTTPYNRYGSDNGTSMSAPAVVGGLGLLYQRYQQLYGVKPESALMKPLLCNSATDLGPAGPDYGYGFGFMNLYRAIKVLDEGNFYKDSVANQKTKTRTITVPQGVAKLKVMLYWQDPAVSAFTTKPLVNDLDIKITGPGGGTVLPFVLDTLPSLVTNPARPGIDHINNIEQVVIDAPVAGNYSVNVEGYEIGEGDQQTFYIVYDLVPDTVQLTFPANEEVLAPNDNVSVQWDNWGNSNSTFTLEFSTDNGNSWQTISSTIASTFFDWTVPATATNTARLRVTRNSDGKTSSPGSFRIIDVPAVKLSSSQCPGSIAIEWPSVTAASDYEVMWYRNGDMVTAIITADTNYIFTPLSEDSVYYVTVRARNNGLPGRRAYALSVQPNKGDCTNSIHDHDLKPQAIISPLVGRAFTSKQLGIEPVRIQIKNLDNDATAESFTVAYSVNNKPWVSETINDIIPGNGVLDHSFQTPFDFSAPGNYNVSLAVSNPGDPNHYNDTLFCVVRHIANAPVPLKGGVIDNSTLPNNITYNSNYTGVEGTDRFDYEKSIASSQTLRVGNGIVFDNSQNPDAMNPQSVIATYNLSLFDTAKHNVELQFYYTRFSSIPSAIDSLLIRADDSAPWKFVQRFLPADSPWYVSKVFRIPLTDYLKSQVQNFSSSLQVRWTVSNYYCSTILSDVRVFDRTNDAALISIDSLRPYSCNLSNAVPIYVTIQNNNNAAISNVPVKYRINKGNVVSETIASIPAFTTLSYQFTQKADLSSMNDYTIEAWTENINDAFHSNDSSSITLRNHPLITSFPFVEDFEKSNGGYYASGSNSSWEWGTPSSPLITGAASGNHAWKTNLDGIHNAPEFSQLYTACFDFSKLSKPVISLSIAMNTDSCSLAYCDGMNFQYSTNGKDWRLLPLRSVYNWQQQFTSRQYNRWHVASERTMDTLNIVQFRFAFRTDAYNSFEGIGIDDLHVYDSTTTIYEGNGADIRQIINGQQWTEFKKDNKLLGAIQTQGQNIGNVQLQTFTHTGAVRNFHGQYYLNRNFVFKPSQTLSDSVTVRLYFTDKESDSLLFAKNCNSCTLPKNAYRFGISYYKTNDSTELDSLIVNNRKGEWDFIANDKLKIVPFMTGYYVEFKVKDAGEFRLSNGGLDGKSDLPVQIKEFSAERLLSNTDLKWSTAEEINIHHFEIEVAKGNEAFQSEQFEKIGEVISKGRSAVPQSYSFTDNTPDKKGVRYYRLKNVDVPGNYSYPKAIPVVFNEEMEWQVFPNPSNGKYNLLYQSAAGDEIQLRIFNSIGQLVKQMNFAANGFVQRQDIDLSKNIFGNGIYVLQIQTKEKTHILRLVKQ
jgi:hypothetical protein